MLSRTSSRRRRGRPSFRSRRRRRRIRTRRRRRRKTESRRGMLERRMIRNTRLRLSPLDGKWRLPATGRSASPSPWKTMPPRRPGAWRVSPWCRSMRQSMRRPHGLGAVRNLRSSFSLRWLVLTLPPLRFEAPACARDPGRGPGSCAQWGCRSWRSPPSRPNSLLRPPPRSDPSRHLGGLAHSGGVRATVPGPPLSGRSAAVRRHGRRLHRSWRWAVAGRAATPGPTPTSGS
mmetsp:Transcript_79395/g.222970  ORF Transcript_79395/g.222970 Transcript_79395/m.222970 type:complete len:232 (+) Transcript_79395:260-955(+)